MSRVRNRVAQPGCLTSLCHAPHSTDPPPLPGRAGLSFARKLHRTPGRVVTENVNGRAFQTLYGGGRALARNGEFFLPNHLDSTTGLTSSGGSLSQGYQYDPFGNLLNSPTDSNPLQYAGLQNDGSGVLYAQARCYNPAWGRFMSGDPAGFGPSGGMGEGATGRPDG